MAKIFPQDSPQNTGSFKAEPDIYWRLKNQLSDDFIVIHSLPWLSDAAKEIDGRSVPTGEIDFLVLHQKLGILAVEVKGGIFAYKKTKFVYKRTGQKIDPVRQVRRGTHALARLLHKIGLGSYRIGYCVVFPHSEMRESIPLALIDYTANPPQPIILDIRHLNNLGQHIQEIMSYWQQALNTWQIKKQQFSKLIDTLLPSADYTPCWQTRIDNDVVTWLQLSPEQSECLNKINKENRLVVTGFPGTGKTLLLIQHARRLSKLGKKVLVITYNHLLSKHLQDELSDAEVEVCTFYEQCRRAATILKQQIPKFTNQNRTPDSEKKKQEWYFHTAPKLLKQAIRNQTLVNYDALVVDEGQVLHTDWLEILNDWFDNKQITVFCDQTQVFNFENSTSPEEIKRVINAKSTYRLTLNLRSPRTVFEKISQVKTSEYQQLCPRPFEEDTLEELVINDTTNSFFEIVDQLLAEGISKESIVIIDAVFEKQRHLNYEGIKVVSASRFRGLESPVVIIRADKITDETALFCSYTRATSRCIVIYDAINMLKGAYQNFGKTILESSNREEIQQEANYGLTSGIINKDDLDLALVTNQTIDLYWYSDWGGWLIFPDNFDKITRLMWTYHLITTTNFPVYTWDIYDRGTINYFQPVNIINDSSGKYCDLFVCNTCENITPHTRDSAINNDLAECVICLRQEINNRVTLEEKRIQAEFDNTLKLSSQASYLDKKRLSIFLMALGRWNTISYEDKQKFEHFIPANLGGTIGYTVAHFLILLDLIKERNQTIELKELAQKYREKWCPDLASRIDAKSWHSIVANGLNVWFRKEFIIKVTKGVYINNITNIED